MSELTKKILESGLVDQATAELMERWGYLPDGSSDLAAGKAEALMRATVEKDVKETLNKLAERIGAEVDSLRRSRETMLDLNHLRWPVEIDSIRGRYPDDTEIADGATKFIAGGMTAVIDRMGRYYFRPQDVSREWLRPGFTLTRKVSPDGKKFIYREETILEVTELSVGEQLAAIQVSTQ